MSAIHETAHAQDGEQVAPPHSPKGIGRGQAVLALSAIVLLGLILRGYRLSDHCLWFDEAFSWRLSRFSWLEMLRRTAQDNHPPLYFVLLKCWTGIWGTSTLALRSLSTLLSGIAIIGMYLFVSEAFNRNGRKLSKPTEGGEHKSAETPAVCFLPLLAAAFVAGSMFQIRYGWETRMYALGTTLSVFSSWALFRALHEHVRPRPWWVLCGVLNLLFAYTHYYALFSIAAQALFVLAYLLMDANGKFTVVLRHPAFRGALWAGYITLVGWLPWFPFFLQQRAHVEAGFWIRPVGWWTWPNLCYQMFVDLDYPPASRLDALTVAGLCLGICAAMLWRSRAAEYYVFLSALAPFALSFLLSGVGTHVVTLRYFIFAHLYLLACLAAIVAHISHRLERSVASAAVLAILSIGHVAYWQSLYLPAKPGSQEAAEWIANRHGPDEAVVVSDPLIYFSLLYYSPHQTGLSVFHHGGVIPPFGASAVLTDGEIITSDDLSAMSSTRIWIVNMAGSGCNLAVPVPAVWNQKNERRFSEIFVVHGDAMVKGEIVVVEYQIPQQ